MYFKGLGASFCPRHHLSSNPSDLMRRPYVRSMTFSVALSVVYVHDCVSELAGVKQWKNLVCGAQDFYVIPFNGLTKRIE